MAERREGCLENVKIHPGKSYLPQITSADLSTVIFNHKHSNHLEL